MKLQYFAQSDENDPQSSAATPSSPASTTSSAEDIAELKRRLANVTAQRDGLLAKAKAPQSSASATPSSAANNPSSASGDSELQAQVQSQAALIDSLVASQQSASNKQSLVDTAAKDKVSLTDEDLAMILNSGDVQKTYEYVKGLKEKASKHPNNPYPEDNNKPTSKTENTTGKELFEALNASTDNSQLNKFIPGRHNK